MPALEWSGGNTMINLSPGSCLGGNPEILRNLLKCWLRRCPLRGTILNCIEVNFAPGPRLQFWSNSGWAATAGSALYRKLWIISNKTMIAVRRGVMLHEVVLIKNFIIHSQSVRLASFNEWPNLAYHSCLDSGGIWILNVEMLSTFQSRESRIPSSGFASAQGNICWCKDYGFIIFITSSVEVDSGTLNYSITSRLNIYIRWKWVCAGWSVPKYISRNCSRIRE